MELVGWFVSGPLVRTNFSKDFPILGYFCREVFDTRNMNLYLTINYYEPLSRVISKNYAFTIVYIYVHS
jgi:hypothetical protein